MKLLSAIVTLLILATGSAFAADSKSDCLKKEAGYYFERLSAVDEKVEKGTLSDALAATSRTSIAKDLEEKVLNCGGAHLPERKTASQVSLLQ